MSNSFERNQTVCWSTKLCSAEIIEEGHMRMLIRWLITMQKVHQAIPPGGDYPSGKNYLCDGGPSYGVGLQNFISGLENQALPHAFPHMALSN